MGRGECVPVRVCVRVCVWEGMSVYLCVVCVCGCEREYLCNVWEGDECVRVCVHVR